MRDLPLDPSDTQWACDFTASSGLKTMAKTLLFCTTASQQLQRQDSRQAMLTSAGAAYIVFRYGRFEGLGYRALGLGFTVSGKWSAESGFYVM